MFRVEPTVTLDGTRITCDADRLGIVPIVMSDLQVVWGRSGYYDRTDPTRLTLRLWDSGAEWAMRIRDSRAIGAPVTLTWTAGTTTVTMFRGSVATAHAERLDRTDAVGRRVWEITLTVEDPTAALGNVFPFPGYLKDGDTMEARRVWLSRLCQYGGLDVKLMSYQKGYVPAKVHGLEVGKDSALDLINAFYDSMSGDAWTYDPESNQIHQCERMDWNFHTYLGSFDDSRGAVRITATDAEINGINRPGVALSGCELRVPDGIEISAATDTDINAVESTWKDPLDEWKDKVAWRSNVPLGTSKRLLSNHTWMTTDWAIELQLQSAWDRARNEGRRPHHPNLVYRAGHQFATERLARWWLQCWENARPGFINGDTAHEWLMQGAADWPPLVSPLGGTITYNGTTGWTFDLTVQWMANRLRIAPITWALLQQVKWSTTSPNVPWWWSLVGLPKPPAQKVGAPTPERDVYWGAPDPDGKQYRFDESVTWGDLKHLDKTTREIKDVLQ